MLIVLNHKMNLNINEIRAYEEAVREFDVVVMPQTPYMGLFTGGKYTLGSQCISEYNAPGGVSAEALVGLNVKYVLVGHAERRIVRQENDEIIAQKLMALIRNNMLPILCVGETMEEKKAGQSHVVIEEQLCNVLNKLEVLPSQLHIAYEPVWCIGTNEVPSEEEISGTFELIKKLCLEKYHLEPTLLYGGSVNHSNVQELKKIPGLEGFVIGTASLSLEEVVKLYELINS